MYASSSEVVWPLFWFGGWFLFNHCLLVYMLYCFKWCTSVASLTVTDMLLVIGPRLSTDQYNLTVQNRDLKHHSFHSILIVAGSQNQNAGSPVWSVFLSLLPKWPLGLVSLFIWPSRWFPSWSLLVPAFIFVGARRQYWKDGVGSRCQALIHLPCCYLELSAGDFAKLMNRQERQTQHL